jgi:DNA-binding NtrC family response regulator
MPGMVARGRGRAHISEVSQGRRSGRVIVLAEGEVLTVEFPAKRHLGAGAVAEPAGDPLGPRGPSLVSLETVERQYIQEVLRHTGGQIGGKGGAAEILGLPPSTLRSRLRKLELKLRCARVLEDG